MLRIAIVSVALCGLVSTALASHAPGPRDASPAAATATSPGDCDSGEPCLRVYKTSEDVQSQSYKVVTFSEAEIVQAAGDNPRRVHNKIVDETGFDCKKGKHEYGVFRCEAGALYTRHDLLIKVLQMLYE